MSETTNEIMTVTIGSEAGEIADYEKLIQKGEVSSKVNKNVSSAMAAQVAGQPEAGEYMGYTYDVGEAIIIVESTRSSQASINNRGSMSQRSMIYRPGMDSGSARSDRNTFIGTCHGHSPILLTVPKTEEVDLGEGASGQSTSLEYMRFDQDEIILRTISLILDVDAAAEIESAKDEDSRMANAIRVIFKVSNIARLVNTSRIQLGLVMGLMGDKAPVNRAFSFPDATVLDVTHAHGVSDTEYANKSKQQILGMTGSSWMEGFQLSRKRIGMMATQNAQAAQAGKLPVVGEAGAEVSRPQETIESVDNI